MQQFSRVRVLGVSMSPTYRPGDVLLCRRLRPGRVRRGMVIVLSAPPNSPFAPGSKLIKRVAGTAGDLISGALIGQPAQLRVPAGQLALLGDNEEFSYDSRSARGFFDAEDVQARVLFRLKHGTGELSDVQSGPEQLTDLGNTDRGGGQQHPDGREG